jgi:hypothetical protein
MEHFIVVYIYSILGLHVGMGARCHNATPDPKQKPISMDSFLDELFFFYKIAFSPFGCYFVFSPFFCVEIFICLSPVCNIMLK